jgi:osmotically-inducible protein OsmY
MKIPIPLIGAGAAAAGVAVLLDKRRRNMARDRAAAVVRRGAELAGQKADYAAGIAKGAAHVATERVRKQDREYDDVTLARKVESEIFRPEDAPKGDVSVNAQDGVVELRGEVKRPEQVKELGEAAARVEGVKDVHNLLHTPGSPPKHAPPSNSEDARARAKESG